MPHSSVPAKILVNGDMILNQLSNATAIIAKGAGSGTTGSIDLVGAPRSLNVGNGTNDIDLSIDVPISNGALTKLGAGTMRLTAANTYATGTTVSTGRLLVNNTTGSGTGTGSVTVNDGTLGGTGTISGAVTVNSGGTISPGATAGSIGTLTLSSSPTFNGTNFMEINRNGDPSQADKIVLSGGALNYGGTLVVSNIGATLVGGEVFTIFTNSSGTSYTGAFANTILPPLNTGLNWYLGNLTVNGTIKVNRKPVANPVTYTNFAPNVLQIPIASLIANDTDSDGDLLSVASINLTTTNGVTLQTNSTFIFYSNYVSVADQFNYIISDGRGGSATGVVQIASHPAGRFAGAPFRDDDSVTLHFVGSPGWTYYVERSTNLPVWLTIGTNVAPANGLFDYVDDYQNLSEPPASAFYRLRWSQ
jgi:autotransporter-associated beta strand protein